MISATLCVHLFVCFTVVSYEIHVFFVICWFRCSCAIAVAMQKRINKAIYQYMYRHTKRQKHNEKGEALFKQNNIKTPQAGIFICICGARWCWCASRRRGEKDEPWCGDGPCRADHGRCGQQRSGRAAHDASWWCRRSSSREDRDGWSCATGRQG